MNGQKGHFSQVNYSTAKADIHGFTMALAQEVAAKGITVNTVSPGYIGTDMVRAVRPEVMDAILQSIPIGRLGCAVVRRKLLLSFRGLRGTSRRSQLADFSLNGSLHMG